MEKVAKSVWQYAVKNGFVPRHNVKKTSHGRFYYPESSDYRRMNEFMAHINEVNNK